MRLVRRTDRPPPMAIALVEQGLSGRLRRIWRYHAVRFRSGYRCQSVLQSSAAFNNIDIADISIGPAGNLLDQ